MKRSKRALAMAGALVAGLVAAGLAGCQATRAGYESAPYTVVRSDGKFELRDYPTLTVVETPMAVGSRDGEDGSFMRLFRFITGGNDAKQKIVMTTPVLMSGGGTNATMAFVMPKKMSADAGPKPNAPEVSVAEIPGGEFAVLRYSGGRSAANQSDKLAQLRAWLARENLTSDGTLIYGYFDPPWTPAFLRRNEVMLRTDRSPANASSKTK